MCLPIPQSEQFDFTALKKLTLNILKCMQNLQERVQFKSMKLIQNLYKLQVHVGHFSFERNPMMNYYIIGTYQNYDILNVTLTIMILKKAFCFTSHLYNRFAIFCLFQIQ